jgi:Tfp pilus assembly protein PilE
MKKLKSFTIVELTVSLLIGAIVIGIAYYTLLLFMNQYKAQQGKSNLIREYLLFRKAIDADIDHYDFMTDSASFIIFKNLNFSNMVQYNFDGNFIVRNSLNSNDTFYIKKQGCKFYHLNDRTNLVKRMDVSFNADKDNLEITFDKPYSSRELIMYHQ